MKKIGFILTLLAVFSAMMFTSCDEDTQQLLSPTNKWVKTEFETELSGEKVAFECWFIYAKDYDTSELRTDILYKDAEDNESETFGDGLNLLADGITMILIPYTDGMSDSVKELTESVTDGMFYINTFEEGKILSLTESDADTVETESGEDENTSSLLRFGVNRTLWGALYTLKLGASTADSDEMDILNNTRSIKTAYDNPVSSLEGISLKKILATYLTNKVLSEAE